MTSGGLQAERTVLAWRRTALGLVANAVLLSIHLLRTTGPVVASVPAGIAVLLAALAVWHSRRREVALRHRPTPDPLDVRPATVLGVGVVVLALVSGVVLLA